MAKRPLPCPTVVRLLLSYELEAGKLFWRQRAKFWFGTSVNADSLWRSWNKRFAGTEALTTINTKGYPCGTVCGVPILAHRAAWAHHYGAWPVGFLDHRDSDQTNFRISNLREATQSQNCCNRSSRKGSTSQYLGVCRVGKAWRASIQPQGKTPIYLGHYENEIDAARVYDAAAKTYYGEFARLNLG